jgi:hypothetical protein
LPASSRPACEAPIVPAVKVWALFTLRRSSLKFLAAFRTAERGDRDRN